jgi:hypothetical protein
MAFMTSSASSGRTLCFDAHHAVLEMTLADVALVVVGAPSRPCHAAKAPADALELRAGRALRVLQQEKLVVGGGHPRERAHLGEAELTARERRIDMRKVGERLRHANLLTRRAGPEPDAPAQPVRTAPRALPSPTAGLIETPNGCQQAMCGRIDVCGCDGNVVSKRIDFIAR